MSPRAVLVGLPGAGKSTTGHRLAKRLGLAFADSDDLIESRVGQTVSEIFASAGAHRLGPLLSPAAVLYPLAFLTGALALGAVATGMLLGHWYLIDLGLSIEPLRRLFRYFVAVLLLHLAVLAATLVVMSLAPGPGTAAVATLWHEHRSLLAARFVLGPLAALGLGYLIDRTLRIPQTMAATGLSEGVTRAAFPADPDARSSPPSREGRTRQATGRRARSATA